MEKNKIDDLNNVILEKIAIMIDIMMVILNCSYSDAYSIIQYSKAYTDLKEYNYAQLHDSPQANLADIGEELRMQSNSIGNLLTYENIILAMKKLREINLKSKQ